MDDNDFNYQYEALTEEQKNNIKNIVRKYETKTNVESDYNQLRKLDNRIKTIPLVICIAFIILGCDLHALGIMTFTKDIDLDITLGIIINALGIIFVVLGIIIYKLLKAYLIKKYLPKINELTDKLLK